jgi:hypothetical protein
MTVEKPVCHLQGFPEDCVPALNLIHGMANRADTKTISECYMIVKLVLYPIRLLFRLVCIMNLMYLRALFGQDLCYSASGHQLRTKIIIVQERKS